MRYARLRDRDWPSECEGPFAPAFLFGSSGLTSMDTCTVSPSPARPPRGKGRFLCVFVHRQRSSPVADSRVLPLYGRGDCYPSPLLAVDVVINTMTGGGASGLRRAQRKLSLASYSPVSFSRAGPEGTGKFKKPRRGWEWNRRRLFVTDLAHFMFDMRSRQG